MVTSQVYASGDHEVYAFGMVNVPTKTLKISEILVDWPTAAVVPIHKKDPTKDKPVSHNSICCKLLERFQISLASAETLKVDEIGFKTILKTLIYLKFSKFFRDARRTP